MLNIGAEGQLLAGAIGATWIALRVGPLYSAYIIIPMMLLTGFSFGAFWALIPAVLKSRFGINETIVTLMLNYIAAEIVQYLVLGPWKGKTQFGFPYTDRFPASAYLNSIPGTRIHWISLLLAIAFAFLTWFILNKSRWGFEARVAGENPSAARYAGISITRTVILVMLWSGGLAGLAGGRGSWNSQILDLSYCDFLGLWLYCDHCGLAFSFKPLAVLLSSIFFAGILVGGTLSKLRWDFPLLR